MANPLPVLYSLKATTDRRLIQIKCECDQLGSTWGPRALLSSSFRWPNDPPAPIALSGTGRGWHGNNTRQSAENLRSSPPIMLQRNRCALTRSAVGLGRVKTLERTARVEPYSPKSECLGDRWQFRFELNRLSGKPFPSVSTLSLPQLRPQRRSSSRPPLLLLALQRDVLVRSRVREALD